MQILITTTGHHTLTNVDLGLAGAVVAEVVISGGGSVSMTPEISKSNGSGAYYNAAYFSVPTGDASAAGTAITTAGIYEWLADGCIGSLNVASITGTVTINVDRVIGGGTPGVVIP